MKIRSIVTASALALACQLSLAAGGPLTFGGSSGTVGFSSTPATGGFTDVYTFTLADAGTLSGSITTVVNGTQDLDFTGIFLTGPSGVFNFTQILGDPFETWGLAATNVAAGSYSLALIGLNSADPASYGGNLAVTLVPEPGPLSLLLAGLAVVGLLTRRHVH